MKAKIEEIRRIISNYVELPQERLDAIDSNTTFIEELQLDSFSIMSIVADIEDSFGITVPIEEIRGISTVGEMAELIDKLQKDGE